VQPPVGRDRLPLETSDVVNVAQVWRPAGCRAVSEGPKSGTSSLGRMKTVGPMRASVSRRGVRRLESGVRRLESCLHHDRHTRGALLHPRAACRLRGVRTAVAARALNMWSSKPEGREAKSRALRPEPEAERLEPKAGSPGPYRARATVRADENLHPRHVQTCRMAPAVRRRIGNFGSSRVPLGIAHCAWRCAAPSDVISSSSASSRSKEPL
jgi:hypothetical protein